MITDTKFEGEPTMITWSKDELRKIAEADDLHISPFREDGVTYGTPTWIWSVAGDDALYVRGYNGQNKPRGKLTAIRRGDAVQRASVFQRAVDRVYKLDA